METKNFNSINLIRCVSGASLNLFRYAAMVIMLLMLAIGNVWGNSSTTYYANLTISKTGETGKGKVYYATSNTKPGSETSGALKSSGSTTSGTNQTYYWWVDVDPGYNVTLSGNIAAGPATAATLSGNVACAQSSSSGSGTSYSATANIVAVTVNSVDAASKDLAPTNPSIDYPFTVTFATSNLKTIALDLNKSPETADGKFTITSWALDGANVKATGKFNGGGSYGGASRNHSTTVSLQSKASGSAAKTCTVTANFPALEFVSATATDVFTTTSDATKTGTAVFNFNYGAEDDFPTAPTFTHTSGAGAFTVVGDPVIEPNFTDGTCKVTVEYQFNPNGTAGTTKEELKITSVGGSVSSVTVTGEAEAEATDDAKVIASDGETLIYQGDWATAWTKANTAANAGCTLQVLRDITGGSLNANQTVTNTFTLDLNGKVLTAKYNGSIIYINKSGKTLTIKDSKTGGMVKNLNDSYSSTAYCVNLTAGNLILESGTLYVSNVISGYGACGILQKAATTITINGGKVEAHGHTNTFGIDQASSKANSTTLTINNGEISADGASTVYAIRAYGKVNINAGTITSTASVQNAFGIRMLAYSHATAANCYYGTLTMKGGTINVDNVKDANDARYAYGIYFDVANTAMGTATATDGSHANKAAAVGSIENATINVTTLGRYAYGILAYGSYQSKTNEYDVIKIKDTKIDATAKYYYAYGVDATGGVNGTHGAIFFANIELTNCEVNAKVDTYTTAYAVYATSSSATVYKNVQPNYYGEYAGGATVTINSGIYTATTGTTNAYAVCSSTRSKTTFHSDSNVAEECKLGEGVEGYATLNIHGGEFTATSGTTTARAVSSGGHTTIDGGTFTANAGTTTAYAIYAISGTLDVAGVEVNAEANSTAVGVYVDCAISTISGFKYYADATLKNLTVTAITRSGAEADGVLIANYKRNLTAATLKSDSTSNKWSTASYNQYANIYQYGEYAVGPKCSIIGGTYTAKSATTTAYGVRLNGPAISADSDNDGTVAYAYGELNITNAKITSSTNGTTTVYGVWTGGPTTITNCDITASSKTTTCSGVLIEAGKTTISGTTITATGTETVRGIYVNSRIAATSSTQNINTEFSGVAGFECVGELEASDNIVTASATSGNTAYGIYLHSVKGNTASGPFMGDHAIAGKAIINSGTYKATATGTTAYGICLNARQNQNGVIAQPECEVTGGKFWGKATGGTDGAVNASGVKDYFVLKGGVYNVNTNLATYIPEGYEEFPLPSDRPEYTEGYRYAIEEEGNHGIDVCKIGSTTYKTLEEALQVATSGNTILMIANYTLPAGDWILKSGVKLLVPYSGQTATKETGVEYVEGTATPAQNLKLSFANGAHLVCKGIIEAGAKQTGQGSSELTGQVYGSYGHIYMAEGSSITIESGATLYAWGYVTGKGEITVKNGGKAYEMFQFGWYKGGNTTSDINSNKGTYKIFPMSDYSYQNIECPITYYPGASGYGKVSVKPSSYSSMQRPLAMLVGTDDNSMFKMTTAEASANTWVKKVYDPETDITNWIMNSGASISGISMNVGVQVNSADFYLPITSNFRITLNYGDLNINNDVIFLPGSQLIINKEATGILKSGKLLFFYDAEDWFTGLGHVSVTASGWSKAKTCGYYYYPATYSPTWGTSNPRKNVYARDKASIDKGVTPLPDAELFLHGKLELNGSLYTSGDGNKSSKNRNANIHSTNEDAGKIIFNTTAPTSSKALYKVCFAIGASEANNSWSDMIYGGQTTAYPAHLQNGDGAYEQSSGTTSGSSWIYKNDQWVMVTTEGCFSVEQVSGVKHYYAYPAGFVEVSSKDADAGHLYHDAATGTRNFVWDQNCYWWEVVTTPTAEGYYKSINADYNGKYNYYYYDSAAECWKIKKITVTWNIDGSTTDYSVGYGTKPEWYGGTPAKNSSSSDFYYIWDGWTASGSETLLANSDLPEVTADITYTAHFYEKYYQYNITFKNDDGTVLESKNWNSGSTPSYEGTPEKAPTASQTFEFNGTWSPAITTVSKAATYVAQYTAKTRQYDVTFLNYDMSVLGTTKVDYDKTPSHDTYKAAIAPSDYEPYKPDNSAYSFEFAGWRLNGAEENGFVQVKGDQIYVAQFAETTKKYKVSFVDDDETLLHWTQLEYGATPSYTWDNPANKQDAEWNYSFTGWTPATFSEVQGPQTYVANYDKTKRKYKITWLNDDNSQIDQTEVEYGVVPTHADATKANTAEYTYTFTGWDNTPVAVTGAATYKATFSSSKNSYEITWLNDDNSLIDKTTVEYGVVPTHADATKENTAEYTYTFTGWNSTPVAVTGAATYKATFSSTKNSYTITWLNEDGTQIDQTEVEYGVVPTHADATKLSTNEYDYTFTGWDNTPVAVTGNATYTAQFEQTDRPYTITWKNIDGTVLTTTTNYWGEKPAYPILNNGIPTYIDNVNHYQYVFDGWDPEIHEVNSDDNVYTAKYSRINDLDVPSEHTVDVETTVTSTTVRVAGRLVVNAPLNTDDLILEATPSTSGEIIGEHITVSQHAYFDLTPDGGDGTHNRKWYAFAVPWEVDAATGIYNKDYMSAHLGLGTRFDILYYDGALRQAQGNSSKCWKFLEYDSDKTLKPGKLYMIHVAGAPIETIRFEKKSESPIHNTTVEVSVNDGQNGNEDANWNGIANPATYKSSISISGGASKAVSYGGGLIGADGWITTNMETALVVGQPIMVQVPNGGSAVLAGASSSPVRRAQHAGSPSMEYAVEISNDGNLCDRLFVDVDEEKEPHYVIGRDLVKVGQSTARAQMWINCYDTKLSFNTVAPQNDKAEYPLSIYAPNAGEYMIEATKIPEEGSYLYLTYDGAPIWNLNYNGYMASLEAGTTDHYGLRLVLASPQVATSIEEAVVDAQGEIRKVLINDQVLIIRGDNVYNAEGQLVK